MIDEESSSKRAIPGKAEYKRSKEGAFDVFECLEVITSVDSKICSVHPQCSAVDHPSM